jgi:hypothetical protein
MGPVRIRCDRRGASREDLERHNARLLRENQTLHERIEDLL